MKELIEELNAQHIVQSQDEEDLDEILEDWDFIENGLDIDKHRWYETSIAVFKNKDNNSYLGVRIVSDIFSESMSISDVEHEYKFYEMEPVTTITYAVKQ